jgi:hypothetical protein
MTGRGGSGKRKALPVANRQTIGKPRLPLPPIDVFSVMFGKIDQG